jgi:hypothetical protein
MVLGDSPLVMRNAQIDGNRTTTTSASSADVGPSGSALELDGPGTISNTSILGNIVKSMSPGGVAATNGGLAVLNFTGDPKLVTVQNSVVSRNITEAHSSTGSATVHGGAVFNNSLLLMRNVRVSDNMGQAEGPTGAAQGGGVWNGVDVSGPPVQLTIDHTSVTNNVLTGSRGISLQGGGLFTTSPITLTHTLIALNGRTSASGVQAARSQSVETCGDLVIDTSPQQRPGQAPEQARRRVIGRATTVTPYSPDGRACANCRPRAGRETDAGTRVPSPQTTQSRTDGS